MHLLYHALDRVGRTVGRCQPVPPRSPVTPPHVAGRSAERRHRVCLCRRSVLTGHAQGPNASFHRLYDREPRPTASRDVQRAVPLGLLT